MMFPAEFADFAPGAFRLLAAHGHRGRFSLFDMPVESDMTQRCLKLLEGEVLGKMLRRPSPIPASAMTRMQHSRTEQLPKCQRFRTTYLTGRREATYRACERIGLIAMMQSESLREFAQAATGRRLSSPNAEQILFYTHGDYVGPHNDYMPEHDSLRHGYIEVHIMLSNDAVAQQFLVYARRGHLDQIRNIAMPSGIALYHLPFWHYTTPLVAVPGQETRAMRWVLCSRLLLRQRGGVKV